MVDSRSSGAEGASLLTNDNFEGHELEVWGFPIARDQGLEYLTPFDYQGEDAAWIWEELVERVALHLIAVKHGLEQGDAGWEAAVSRYGKTLQAQVSEGDAAWLREYGDIREAREFLEVVIWTARREAPVPRLSPFAPVRAGRSKQGRLAPVSEKHDEALARRRVATALPSIRISSRPDSSSFRGTRSQRQRSSAGIDGALD